MLKMNHWKQLKEPMIFLSSLLEGFVPTTLEKGSQFPNAYAIY
jgi:hypothetical protein